MEVNPPPPRLAGDGAGPGVLAEMASSEETRSSDRPAADDDEVVTTRRGRYAPEPPERLSRASRLIVRAEIAVGVALVLSLVGYQVAKHREDRTPIRIASVAVPGGRVPSIPSAPATAGGEASADAGSAEKGQVLYMQSCTSCHGQRAQGLPHMGLNLRDSRFVAQQNDRKLVAFLKQGRKPTDPKNVTGLLMPPRGGNPSLDDDSLTDIVAFLRQVQKEEQAERQSSPQQQREASADKGSPTAAATPSPATRPVAELDAGELGE